MGSCHSAPPSILSKKSKLNKTVNKLKRRGSSEIQHHLQNTKQELSNNKPTENHRAHETGDRLENEEIRLIDDDDEFYSSDESFGSENLPQIEIRIQGDIFEIEEENYDNNHYFDQRVSFNERSNYDNLNLVRFDENRALSLSSCLMKTMSSSKTILSSTTTTSTTSQSLLNKPEINNNNFNLNLNSSNSTLGECI